MVATEARGIDTWSSLQKTSDFEALITQIKAHVTEAIYFLLARKFSFDTILRQSGVNRVFLKRSFEELGLETGKIQELANKIEYSEAAKYQTDPCTIPETCMDDLERIPERELNVCEEDDRKHGSKNIEFEMRLVSLRIQTELSKITSLMNDDVVQEQLMDDLVRHNLFNQKVLIRDKLDLLFSKMPSKGDQNNRRCKRKSSDERNDVPLTDMKHRKYSKEERFSKVQPIQTTEKADSVKLTMGT